EWSDGCAVIAIEGQVYDRRTAFCFWLRGCTIPGAICDMVWCCHIIHECEGLTFVDGDGVLYEVEPGHVNLWAARAHWLIPDCTGGQDSGHQAKYKQAKAYLFIHRDFLVWFITARLLVGSIHTPKDPGVWVWIDFRLKCKVLLSRS